MDYTELLPPLPVGDRFIDQTKFRRLGRGAGHELYECWDDAIQAYALAAIAAAAPAIRRTERERAAAVCELMRDTSLGAQRGDPSDLSNVMLRQVAELGWGQAAEAIRALPEEP